MPRLIVIDGPRTGDWVQLQGDNWLGFRGGQLAISFQPDLQQQWAFLRVLPDRAELHNLGVGAHVLLNGGQFSQAYIKHGDIIAMYDTRFIFDTDDRDGQGSGVVSQNRFQHKQPDVQHSGAFNMPGTLTQSIRENSEDLLGSISSSATNDQIADRVRYRNQDEMMAAVKDAKRMQILLKIAGKLSTLDMSKLLNDLLDIIFEVLPADRGTCLIYDPNRRRFRTVASKIRGGGTTKVRISRTIAKEVLKTKESILSADAQADDRFSLGMSIVDEDIRSALCVPILSNDEIMGLIHLDTQSDEHQFDRKDLELLTAIAMQAALAIENARLVNEIAEQERMRYELDLAATIQQQLLPRRLPESRELDVYGKMIPAKELGGDYFDFIDHGNGEFHICVGDVSGKGLPAGLVMVMARSYLRPLCRNLRGPKRVLLEANRLLHSDTRSDMFMSAILLYWSDHHKKFLWSGAGHEHLLIYRARTGTCESIKAGGVVLAMVADTERILSEQALGLESGDTVVLYTDGVTEAVNPQGEMFAEDTLDPLIQLVARYGNLSAKDLLEAILWELRNFMGNAPQADDITIVTIKKR